MSFPFESSILLTDAACQIIFASTTTYIEESSSNVLDFVANSTLHLRINSSGITLNSGASVDTIETTITDDDTHLPTSGAVVDYVATINLPSYGTDNQIPYMNGTTDFQYSAGLSYDDTNLQLTSYINFTTGNVQLSYGGSSRLNILENNSVIIGNSTASTSAANNIIIGTGAGNSLTISDDYHVMIGVNAGAECVGDNNMYLGYNAGRFNQGGTNVAIGYFAGYGVTATSNYTNSVAIGSNALYSVTSATASVAIGSYSLWAVTSNSQSTGVGYATGRYQTGSANTFVGSSSGQGLTANHGTGGYNVGVGYSSLYRLTSGTYNMGIGYNAISGSDTTNGVQGSYNIGIGGQSLTDITTGAGNIGIGYLALSNVTTGPYSIAIGYRAGENLITGNRNILIGYQINADATDSTYQFKLGYNTNILMSGNLNSGELTFDQYGTGTITGTEAYYLAVDSFGNIIEATIPGAGATTFLGLTDTPSSYSGSGNYFVRVNSTPDQLEFVAASSINLSDFNDDLTYGTGDVSWGTASNKYVVFGSSGGDIESSSSTVFDAAVADGASAVAYLFNTDNLLSTSGALIFKVQNNSNDRFYMEYSGNLRASAGFIADNAMGGTGYGSYSYDWVQIYVASIQRMSLHPSVSDGGSAEAYKLATSNVLSTAGAKLLTILNTSTERFALYYDGALLANAYGGGSFTGTATYMLAVDSSGNIIEEALPSAGTTTFVGLTDTPANYTSSGGFLVMVNSAPDGLEFIDPSGYALSNFNNDLSFAQISGTPANNLLAVWTSAVAIEGEANLTYNGSDFGVNGYTWINTSAMQCDNATFTFYVGSGSDIFLYAVGAGATSIYYDGSARLATSSTGVSVTGYVSCSDNADVRYGTNKRLYYDELRNRIQLGESVGNDSSTGGNGIFIGYSCGTAETDGIGNLAIGYQSGDAVTSGDYNISFGYQAGRGYSTGGNNIAMGRYSLNACASTNSIAIGYEAQRYGTSGNYNITIGYRSGRGDGTTAPTASNNVFIGPASGYGVTSGGSNVALGYNAGYSIGSGQSNMYMGYNSGQYSTNSSYCVGVGAYTGFYSTGNYNFFLGYQAGYGVNGSTTGTYNVFIGTFAGSGFTTGGNNVLIGYNVQLTSSTDSNVIKIGNGTTIVYRGDSSTGYVYLDNIQNTTNGNYLYYNSSTGEVTYNTTSDIRLKKDITSWEPDSLKFLNDQRIINFRWKDGSENKCIGWDANQMSELMPSLTWQDEEGYWNYYDAHIRFHFHRAIKQLSSIYESHEDKITRLEKRVEELENQLNIN